MRLVLATGRRPLDVGAPHHEVAAAAPNGTVLVSPQVPGDRLLQRDADGGWCLHPDLFWSWLRPLAAADQPVDDAGLAAVWAGLRRWRGLPVEEAVACEALCERHTRGAGEVLTILGRVAAAGEPGGVGAVAPAEPEAAPPMPALSEPDEVSRWVMDAEGLGAHYGSRFVPREQQAQLAAAYMRAFLAGEALLAEAGTGTGKTLAYLVPLLARLGAGSGRAVISTYSRALQRQILDGDLPHLLADRSEKGARLLMGRANYLCLRQRLAYLTRPLDDGREALKTMALRLWLQATTDGLREELVDHPLLGEDLPQLFTSVQPCTPQCHSDRRCFVTRARRLARQASIVVVIHALLLLDNAAGGGLIGPYNHLVVDEAHRLPGATLDARTVGLHRGRQLDLEALVGKVRGASEGLEVTTLLAERLGRPQGDAAAAEAAATLGKATSRALRAFASWWRAAGSRLELPANAVPGQRVRVADKDATFAPIRDETTELLAHLAAANAASAALNQRSEDLDDLEPVDTDLLLRCAQAGQLLSTLERDVRFVTAVPTDRWVTWIDPSSRGGVATLGATPLESGPFLKELWQDAEVAPVATSATLAVGEDFGFMLAELGLMGRHPRTATVAVPSPFRWDQQAVCLAPERIPDPDQGGFAVAIAEVIGDLRREIPRQTLVLFTSYRLLQDVAGLLTHDHPGGELLVQSPGTGAETLRERFRDSRGATLLGTSTFWEGVDFPGASLEIVVVTKLPFQVPTDPWVQARCEHLRAQGEDPFSSFMVRDAVLRLRQGVGRLLRRSDDRGAILLLDNRLITRRYGTTFREALPAAVTWLPHHRALAGAAREFLAP